MGVLWKNSFQWIVMINLQFIHQVWFLMEATTYIEVDCHFILEEVTALVLFPLTVCVVVKSTSRCVNQVCSKSWKEKYALQVGHDIYLCMKLRGSVRKWGEPSPWAKHDLLLSTNHWTYLICKSPLGVVDPLNAPILPFLLLVLMYIKSLLVVYLCGGFICS